MAGLEVRESLPEARAGGAVEGGRCPRGLAAPPGITGDGK